MTLGTATRTVRLRTVGYLLAGLFACLVAIAGVDLDKMQRLALERYGADTEQRVADWRKLIDDISGLTDEQKAKAVNTFFNDRIRWVEDIDNWKQKDYWATPLETMARRKGDCEDFSIAKYMTLLLADVDMSKLRITYVKAQQGGRSIAHMVLAFYPSPGADPWILDNMVDLTLPASKRSDLKPVYGFNSNGLWVGGRAAPATTDPGAKLSRWRDLLQRMAADGLG